MKVAQIQMNTQEDKAANLRTAERLVSRACEAERPDPAVLPDYYASLSSIRQDLPVASHHVLDLR